MDRKSWTLLALAAAKGKTLSPVQLQKTLFLVGKRFEDELDEFYTFRAYDYGPFSKDIYSDARQLAAEGMVAISEAPWGRWSEYAATEAGLSEVERVADDVPDEVRDYIDRVVEWARSLSFQQLLRAVYAKYPDYQDKSVFKDPRVTSS